jgi:hypothetical protein
MFTIKFRLSWNSVGGPDYSASEQTATAVCRCSSVGLYIFECGEGPIALKKTAAAGRVASQGYG